LISPRRVVEQPPTFRGLLTSSQMRSLSPVRSSPSSENLNPNPARTGSYFQQTVRNVVSSVPAMITSLLPSSLAFLSPPKPSSPPLPDPITAPLPPSPETEAEILPLGSSPAKVPEVVTRRPCAVPDDVTKGLVIQQKSSLWSLTAPSHDPPQPKDQPLSDAEISPTISLVISVPPSPQITSVPSSPPKTGVKGVEETVTPRTQLESWSARDRRKRRASFGEVRPEHAAEAEAPVSSFSASVAQEATGKRSRGRPRRRSLGA